ncbi:DDE superendonuclease family protein [Orientia tsutsugamushi str. Kato PP]|uniref:IS5 family transposase ISOt6 n=1 Tax=Orientia tsutsugamushi TaxID=784 RepID=A0A2U3QW32_ORITS|nr:DDE superendonuclease family protein [Orientia tsutsugamushi str. Kato PP]SPR05171.1 IS5 family transposase ISOt6 [Orientia tsutsugamushi]
MILNYLRNPKFLSIPRLKRLLIQDIKVYKKIHNNSELQKKKSKKNPLTKNDKKNNRRLAGERVVNENVIGMLKRFKIIADKYRNRRKRFGLRFNLISGIYNFELLGGLLYFYLNSSLQPSIISLYTSLLPSYPNLALA